VVALAALAGLVIGVALALFRSRRPLTELLLVAAFSLVVVAAAAWWAFTTRRRWKRWLNAALVALVAAALLTEVVAFGLWDAGWSLGIVALLFVYPAAARRALASHAGSSAPALAAAAGAARPAAPWLLVNPRSGGGKAERTRLADAARSRGVRVRLLAAGDDAGALARQAVADGADAIGMAGGDGSLAQVAAAAIELDVPFVCVPAGTRNHFAHDLGLDRADPLAALEAFGGRERIVDVGMVGDRVFLNNVSLGACADLVAEPGHRARKLATAHAVLSYALRGERAPLEVSFHDPDGQQYEGVLVLLVANNRYELRRLLDAGARERLDAGVLQVSALRARTGVALAGAVARTAAGLLDPAAGWAQWTSTAFRVDSRLPRLPAGVDGEAVMLQTPVEFRVLPRALRVLLPSAPGVRPALGRLFRWGTVRLLWAIATRRPCERR
jgi:diacylglycerol kinase family enzyme